MYLYKVYYLVFNMYYKSFIITVLLHDISELVDVDGTASICIGSSPAILGLLLDMLSVFLWHKFVDTFHGFFLGDFTAFVFVALLEDILNRWM